MQNREKTRPSTSSGEMVPEISPTRLSAVRSSVASNSGWRRTASSAAQAMAEPLTQMALSSRHGTLTVKGETKELTGLKGVRQLLDVPKAF